MHSELAMQIINKQKLPDPVYYYGFPPVLSDMKGESIAPDSGKQQSYIYKVI